MNQNIKLIELLNNIKQAKTELEQLKKNDSIDEEQIFNLKEELNFLKKKYQKNQIWINNHQNNILKEKKKIENEKNGVFLNGPKFPKRNFDNQNEIFIIKPKDNEKIDYPTPFQTNLNNSPKILAQVVFKC